MSYDRREAELAAKKVRLTLLAWLIGGPLLVGEALLYLDGWRAVFGYVVGGLLFVTACVCKALEGHHRRKEGPS